MNFETKNLIVLYYPNGAGGKFIANCLALSKHAVSQNPHSSIVEIENGQGDFYHYVAGSSWPSYAKFLNGASHVEMSDVYQFEKYREYCKLYNSISYYDFKLRVGQDTLPNKNAMHNWLNYEYGCGQFFGKNVALNQLGEFSYVANTICNLTTKFFIVAHTKEKLDNITSTFPNAEILQFVNYDKFATIANALKNTGLPTLLSGSFPLKFDIDNSIMSEEAFIPAMEELYSSLGFDDFNLIEQNLRKFYKAYAALHF